MIGTIRDLTHLMRPGAPDLLFAFDVIGGIGPLPADSVQAAPEDVGYFGARVVLMELISLGARPILVADLLTLRWRSGGERVVAGIRELLAESGFPDVPVTGSTEENVSALSTGAGFVAVGEVASPDLRHGRARPGDRLYLVGVPKSAPRDAVRRGDPAIVPLQAFGKLMEDSRIHEALPLGSGGLEAELALLRERALHPSVDARFPHSLLTASGGPATAALLVVEPHWNPSDPGSPLRLVGRLRAD